MKVVKKIVVLTSYVCLLAPVGAVQAADTSSVNNTSNGGDNINSNIHSNSSNNSNNAPLTQAEQWVKQRSMPDFMAQDQDEKKKKRPVRTFFKNVGRCHRTGHIAR